MNTVEKMGNADEKYFTHLFVFQGHRAGSGWKVGNVLEAEAKIKTLDASWAAIPPYENLLMQVLFFIFFIFLQAWEIHLCVLLYFESNPLSCGQPFLPEDAMAYQPASSESLAADCRQVLGTDTGPGNSTGRQKKM